MQLKHASEPAPNANYLQVSKEYSTLWLIITFFTMAPSNCTYIRDRDDTKEDSANQPFDRV